MNAIISSHGPADKIQEMAEGVENMQLDFPLTWKLGRENFVIFRYFESEQDQGPREQVQGELERYQLVPDQGQGDLELDQVVPDLVQDDLKPDQVVPDLVQGDLGPDQMVPDLVQDDLE